MKYYNTIHRFYVDSMLELLLILISNNTISSDDLSSPINENISFDQGNL